MWMVHDNRKVGISQEVNCEREKCKNKDIIFFQTYWEEWMKHKGASCPLHVIPHKPPKEIICWKLPLKCFVNNTWSPRFQASLQKIKMLLDWDLPHEILGIDRENLRSRYFQNLLFTWCDFLYFTCAKYHIEEREENSGGRLNGHFVIIQDLQFSKQSMR